MYTAWIARRIDMDFDSRPCKSVSARWCRPIKPEPGLSLVPEGIPDTVHDDGTDDVLHVATSEDPLMMYLPPSQGENVLLCTWQCANATLKDDVSHPASGLIDCFQWDCSEVCWCLLLLSCLLRHPHWRPISHMPHNFGRVSTSISTLTSNL